MTNNGSHIIKRQVLDIHTHTRDQVYQLQDQVKDLYYAKMLDVLQRTFDQYDTGDVLRIDQLVIDLGSVSKKYLDEDLLNQFEIKLNEQLSKLVYRQKHESSFEETVTGKIERMATSKSEFELLVFFLETGLLPWWKTSMAANELDEILENQLEKNAESLRHFLVQHRHQPVVIKRLSTQFSEGSREGLKKMLVGQSQNAEQKFLVEFDRVLHQLFQSQALPKSARLVTEQVLLEIYLDYTSGKQNSEKKMVKRLLDALEAKAKMTPLVWAKTILEKVVFANTADRKTYSASFRDVLKNSLPELVPQLHETGQKEHPANRVLDNDKARKNPSSTPKKEKSKTADSAKSKAESHSVEKAKKNTIDSKKKKPFIPEFKAEKVEEIYVQNAGLVLIWNYLPHYFKNAGLMEDGNFKNDEARYHAVHLLQYVVTGNDEAAEYELPLNKLLCGVKLHEPVELEREITEAEKAEAEKMLQAVLSHWGALGSSSSLALRQSFLGRKGMLTNNGNAWILRVEDSGIDILLDKIPWGFSLINYKWMEKPLHVEWH